MTVLWAWYVVEYVGHVVWHVVCRIIYEGVGLAWLLTDVSFFLLQVIGLPPVAHFAQPHVRDKVMREVLSGEKVSLG